MLQDALDYKPLNEQELDPLLRESSQGSHSSSSINTIDPNAETPKTIQVIFQYQCPRTSKMNHIKAAIKSVSLLLFLF
jgi:hypothetical protein